VQTLQNANKKQKNNIIIMQNDMPPHKKMMHTHAQAFTHMPHLQTLIKTNIQCLRSKSSCEHLDLFRKTLRNIKVNYNLSLFCEITCNCPLLYFKNNAQFEIRMLFQYNMFHFLTIY